ncbi:hypothetical protein HOLleu_34313 [Holothuria leucospilota]|uniref:Uncharacterized protein n=1 Tax=Holothuria leucospilota TaxID=206669 RepID=A0A9Q1BF85_HOLLE|nr:hypothetical protein HOLleu_34313 [Holothuria leucospilota]
MQVIRLSYRSLTPEEEKHEEQVWQNWEMFLLQLQDAAEFVHTQMPIKTEELDATFQKYMAEAVQVFTQATSGIYLDPTQNSTRLLSSVMKVCY